MSLEIETDLSVALRRGILAKAVNYVNNNDLEKMDKDVISFALKAASDTDKLAIAKQRIVLDTEANATNKDVAKAIAALSLDIARGDSPALIGIGDGTIPDIDLSVINPPTIVEGELDEVARTLTYNEFMAALPDPDA